MLIENNKHSLIRNIASLGGVQIANYVIPIISVPIISRIIGPEKFGVISYTSSFIAYFTLLIGFGFDLTATRRVSKNPNDHENRNKVFSEVFTSQCILLVLSAIFFIFFLFKMPELSNEKTVAIFTFFSCLATVMTQNWLFQAMQDLPKVAILNLVSKIVFTLLVLLLVQKKSDYIWQPLALSLSQVLISIISFHWAVKKYSLKLHKVKLIDCFKLMWEEKTFFLSLCVINLYSITNVIVLGLIQNPYEVGLYAAGEKLIYIIKGIVLIPLTQALFPYISKSFNDNYDKGILIIQKLLPIIIYFLGAISMIIILVSPIFISFFFGDQFLSAINVCRILSIIPLLVAINMLIGIHLFLNIKMDLIFLRVTTIGAIIGLILNFFLCKRYGYLGPCFTWLAIELFNLLCFCLVAYTKRIRIFNLTYFSIKSVFELVNTVINSRNKKIQNGMY